MKLNTFSRLSATTAAALLLGACADDFNTNDYKVEKPGDAAQYEYLNAYGALKTYVNRDNAGELFRLGGAIDASELAQYGLVYSLASSNYDEVTFGNHMKYNFCVDANGAMDFSRVRTGIEAAEKAGLKVFGHTLCWHSQQQYKYLTDLVKDKEIEVDPNQKIETPVYEIDWGTQSGYSMWGQWGKGAVTSINAADKCLDVNNPEAAANFWDLQYFIADGIKIDEGGEYKVTVEARCSEGEATLRGCIGGWADNKSLQFAITPEWETYTLTFTSNFEAGNSHILVQHGDYVGTVQYRNIKVVRLEAPVMTIEIPLKKFDFNNESLFGWPDLVFATDGGIMTITSAGGGNSWEKQACYQTTTPFENGTKYVLKMRVKGSAEGSVGIGFQNPDGYKGCGDFPALKVTTDWQDVSLRTTCNGDGATRMLFNLGSYAGTLSFESMEICYEKAANSIPLTDEEKEEKISNELKRWIYGMMQACEGKVTAWDVVNEAISDGAPYGVKHFEGSAEKQEFYWQNYLGDNFGRKAVKYAREAFAEYGGDPDKLLLFVNDYNLEAAYNNTAKTDGLIATIAQWEADGVTRIDGIGSQMHVTYSLNPEYQARQEQCVVDMFTKLAASGKLIHVSELDMGISDADGRELKTEELTFEMHQKMSDYYKFIISKYFEIIPAAQRYGIVQWAATDSPEGSGWRPGTPIGIWDLNYARKPAYAGWCEALQEATR